MRSGLYRYVLILLLACLSCFNNDDGPSDETNLSNYLDSSTFETGAVIACAASDETEKNVLVFYYPEANAENIRLYESPIEINPNDYSNYMLIDVEPIPFFNGYLGKFARELASEKWIIVTYELNDSIKVSNPIRTKQMVKPSIWSEDVAIDQTIVAMPEFTWANNAFGDNAIYFQVVSDSQDNLFSGTYTFENTFQYYNTSNVVLNITIQSPPDIVVGNFYKFTLMDVSLDNWVNTIIQKTFEAQ